MTMISVKCFRLWPIIGILHDLLFIAPSCDMTFEYAVHAVNQLITTFALCCPQLSLRYLSFITSQVKSALLF